LPSTTRASPVVTPAGSATLEEEEEEVPAPSVYRLIFFVLVLVGASGGIFAWLGGMRWLRRVLGMQHAGYRKVDDEEDAEK
jgi:hypothetical protein